MQSRGLSEQKKVTIAYVGRVCEMVLAITRSRLTTNSKLGEWDGSCLSTKLTLEEQVDVVGPCGSAKR